MTLLSWINCIVGGVAAYSFVSDYNHIDQLIWFGKFLDFYKAELQPVAMVASSLTSRVGGALPLDFGLLYLVVGSCLNSVMFEQGDADFGVAYVINTVVGLIFWPLSLFTMIFCLIAYWKEGPNQWEPIRGGFIGPIGPEFGIRSRRFNGRTITERLVKTEPRRQRLVHALSQWGREIMHSIWLCLFLVVANYVGLHLLKVG